MTRHELVPHLRALADALPAGTVVPVPREWLLELLASGGDGGMAPLIGDEDALTAAEAAKRLGCSVDWLYRRTAVLPFATKLSRKKVRYSAAGLAEFLRKAG